MMKLNFILILCIAFISEVLSQNSSENLTPDSGISLQAKKIIENYSASESDTGAVIFLREARMFVSDGGLYKVSYHIIGQIYDEKAKEGYSQISVWFNNFYEDITLDFARTFAEDKSYIDISADAIQIKTSPNYSGTKSYTDHKILAFSLPALKPGKFFEYQITTTSKIPVVDNYWFESHTFNLVVYNLDNPYLVRIDPVKVSRFILSLSEAEFFQFEVNNSEIKSEKKVENGLVTYEWEMDDVPTVSLEAGMPYMYEIIPMITVSSIPNWKDYGSWVDSILDQSISVSDEIKNKAFELTANANTKNEKIKLLYDYVRKEIDYIQADLDRGGLKPHTAEEVYRTKYGDCKDQVILLLSFLKAVNITGFPALINTYSLRNHQEFIPTQYFDHMIIFVPGDSADFWLDTTTELNEFPTLYSGDQDRWALVIEKNNVRFLKTPSYRSEQNVAMFNLKMNAHNDTLSGTIELSGLGTFKELFAGLKEYYSKSDLDQYYRDIVESYFYQIAQVKEIKSIGSDSDRQGINHLISFDYIQSTNEYTLFHYSSSAVLAFNLFYITLPFEEKRQYDFIFPFSFTVKATEVLRAPWDYFFVKNCPESDSITSDYFSYRQIFDKYKDSVVVTWEFSLKNNIIPKDNYEKFYDDILKFEKLIGWQIEFQKQLSSQDLVSGLADYFGVNLDSTLERKEYIPPKFPNELNINNDVKKEIVAVIDGYVAALNDGDDELALELLYKDNPEAKYVKRYSKKNSELKSYSIKVENINVIDVVYDYAITTYTTIIDLENNPEIGQMRFDYLSILNKSDHHWKIYRSREKSYIDICMVYSTIALDYYNNEDYDKALVVYDLAMANDSSCNGAFGSAGWIYYLKGNYKKCIEFSEKAIRLDSTALYAHYNIALSYLCLGEVEKSKLKYEQTIELNKNLSQKIHPGAVEDLQNLIKKNFKKEEAENILADLFDFEDIDRSIPAEAK